jgi:hypothetical protein
MATGMAFGGFSNEFPAEGHIIRRDHEVNGVEKAASHENTKGSNNNGIVSELKVLFFLGGVHSNAFSGGDNDCRDHRNYLKKVISSS